MMNFGLGLLSIGRKWGVLDTPPPTREVAIELIAKAVELDVQFFDTAPAYGESEHILGEYLRNMKIRERQKITVATKMGEFWQGSDEPTFVCHDESALKESVDQSLEYLGSIDILQLHKATKVVIENDAVCQAIAYARQRGISQFGASISYIESAEAAISSGAFQWLQFPFNAENSMFGALGSRLIRSGMRAMINRPLAMGKYANDIQCGFKLVYNEGFPDGSIILSGTSSQDHLEQNLAAFRAVAALEY